MRGSSSSTLNTPPSLPDRSLAQELEGGSSEPGGSRKGSAIEEGGGEIAGGEEGETGKGEQSASLWSSLLLGTLAIFEGRVDPEGGDKERGSGLRRGGKGRWGLAVSRVVRSGPMRRLQERLLGHKWTTAAATPGSAMWVLGVCYKIPSDVSDESVAAHILMEFQSDFSSRLWLTYRRGFDSLGQSKLTSDVGWGCMLRSGQMLLAQALICHHLGRSWRRESDQVGSPYGLAAGAWLGPYALCRTIEALAEADREGREKAVGCQVLPMAVYVVSGDADGERGGAPVLCVEDVTQLCSKWGEPPGEWAPLLVLVPLVLGLDKVNPRYLPSLKATFSFPQSLGILGGKPGASTYLVGVQDDQALYLDPHEVQQVVRVLPDYPEVDTSSYHCSVVRRMPLDAMDPSLALGFYCCKREDFEDLCTRSSELAEQSNGAPMFTVAQTSTRLKQADSLGHGSKLALNVQESPTRDPSSEEDWQIL